MKHSARSKTQRARSCLDSEVRILSAKLSDFEEKASSKQRLLTKKMNSTALLKEEKFRKQMQSKFAAKLEVLGRLLQDWERNEGTGFDASLLSDDVRILLSNSDKSGTWIEQRTAFMHLRTAHQKHGSKRRGELPTGIDSASPIETELPGMKHLQRPTTSSRARVAASPARKTRPTTSTTASRATRRDPSPAQFRSATIPSGTVAGVPAGRSTRVGPSAAITSARSVDSSRDVSVSSRVGNNGSNGSRPRSGGATAAASASSHKRHIEPTARLPVKKQHLSPPDDEVGMRKERIKRGTIGKKGLSKTRASTNDETPDSPHSSKGSGTKSLAVDTTRTTTTANPFGAILSKTPTPKHTTKENRPW